MQDGAGSPMYGAQMPWVELYESLLEYDGGDAYDDVLNPWAADNEAERDWIADFQWRASGPQSPASDEELCQLYAIFRVTSLLLLRFQFGIADASEFPGPPITMEGLTAFHQRLGFQIHNTSEFHPFYHEILSVTSSPVADSPVSVENTSWPCLMLGDMMFCRSGAHVCAGSAHVDKSVAESSRLHWTYRRKDRPYGDQSHGWGSNSQWRTRLRRDYRTAAGYHFNVDARSSLNNCRGVVDDLPVSVWIELVRHRSLVKSTVDDSDLYPYPFSYFERFSND